MASSSVHPLEPWHQLGDKVVMVTGASAGLGREFCLDLAKAGCRVVAAARRVDRLRSLCDEINSEAVETRAVAVELDVSADGASIEASVRVAWDAFGRIDALINNAGYRGIIKSPLDLPEDEWDKTVKTNLTGTWLVSKFVGQRMSDAKTGGSIINISSIAGLVRGQLPGGVAYTSTKAAINAMTRAMALELGAYKIRVNSISPGLFKSEITQGLVTRDWIHNVAEKIIPLRSHGTSDPALTSLIRCDGPWCAHLLVPVKYIRKGMDVAANLKAVVWSLSTPNIYPLIVLVLRNKITCDGVLCYT
ncbi:hypothetical protein MLD38_007623 [Melastoma candidum]|uniref:Uncharacterized protein n=1 Tax=Melastoma candidum TaxID=119954 RepID=A0ACB9S084_9MYRT|nr:hypothetical protein MLD38_007623 [Melastoma candidum]